MTNVKLNVLPKHRVIVSLYIGFTLSYLRPKILY